MFILILALGAIEIVVIYQKYDFLNVNLPHSAHRSHIPPLHLPHEPLRSHLHQVQPRTTHHQRTLRLSLALHELHRLLESARQRHHFWLPARISQTNHPSYLPGSISENSVRSVSVPLSKRGGKQDVWPGHGTCKVHTNTQQDEPNHRSAQHLPHQ